MKEYVMFFRGGLDFQNASPEVMQRAMANWKTWMDELAAQGKLVGGQRLTRNGAVLSGTKKRLIDGPFAEGKEVVGGYLSIKANGFEEALELSKGCPIFLYDGCVELREVLA